jgi:AraC-like DNA-binding protein
MGARANYELISTADLAELAGIVIRPGGFATLFRERADLLFGRWTALHDLWPRFAADAILDAPSAAGKLDQLERLLRNRAAHANYPACLVHGAIEFLNCPNATVAACVKESGVSARRFSQVFREHVGLSPKLWSRIQRFQKAVRLLYEGVDLRWAELALDCGYYDQSHFINDFQAFSGINPTTYSGLRGRWQNHISVEG